jgi:hypothetical protein
MRGRREERERIPTWIYFKVAYEIQMNRIHGVTTEEKKKEKHTPQQKHKNGRRNLRPPRNPLGDCRSKRRLIATKAQRSQGRSWRAEVPNGNTTPST